MKTRQFLGTALAAILASAALAAAAPAAAAGLGSNNVVIGITQNGPGNPQNVAAVGAVLNNTVNGGSTGITAENVEQLASVGNINGSIGGGLLPLNGTNNVTVGTNQLLTSAQGQTANANLTVQGNGLTNTATSGLAANVSQLSGVGNVVLGIN